MLRLLLQEISNDDEMKQNPRLSEVLASIR